MDGLTEGRIVHYVMNTKQGDQQHRPAIITRVWDKSFGTVNLTVFTDWENDIEKSSTQFGLVWATSVRYSEDKENGTWHWIEKA